jgi:O-antigen/teichoic acid export membrane protein
MNNSNAAASSSQGSSVKRKALLGLSWQAFNTLSRQVLTFGTGIVLARLLTPEDFGVINIAVIATTWVGILGGLGIETYLIQQGSLAPVDIDAGFWIAGCIGTLSALALFLATPIIQGFYRIPALTGILHVYSLSLLLGGLNIVPAAMLRRSIDFKAVAKVEILGTLTSGCVAISLVVIGCGPVSIAWGGGCGLLVSMIAYSWMGLWSFRPLPTFAQLVKVAKSSLFIAGSKALEVIRIFVDNAMVGRFLGAENLGYYSLGYNLISVPEYRVVGLVTSVAFPTLSMMQMRGQEIGKAYMRILKYSVAVVMPLLIGLALTADRLIPLVYGPTWLPAVPIIRVLSFAGLGTAIVAVTDSPMLALGYNRTVFILNLIWVGVLVAAISAVLISEPTLLGVAWAVTASAIALAVARNVIIVRSAGFTIRSLFAELGAAVVPTISMVLVILAIDHVIPYERPNWMQTTIVIAGGGMVYTAVAGFYFPEIRSFVVRIRRWFAKETAMDDTDRSGRQ